MRLEAYSFAIGWMAGVVFMGGASIWIIISSYHKRFGDWPWSKR